MKVLIIGLDGAEPNLIERWGADLPMLIGLRSRGVWGRLNSTIPPVIGLAWTSFATCRHPRTHGFFSFGQHMAGTSEFEPGLVGATQGCSLLQHLSKTGRLVGIAGVLGRFPQSRSMVSWKPTWEFPMSVLNTSTIKGSSQRSTAILVSSVTQRTDARAELHSREHHAGLRLGEVGK